MKLNKKQSIVKILLIFLVLPMSNLWMNVSMVGAEEIKMHNNPRPSLDSHSSPYHFRVNKSSLLLNDRQDQEMEQEMEIPKASQYWYSHQDYALSLYLDNYAVTPFESIEINLRLTESFNPKANSPVVIKIYRGFYRDYYSWYPQFYDAVLLDTQYFNTDDNGEISYTFFDTAQSGLYTIFAYYSDYVVAYREFSVSNTGIFLKGSKYYMENQDYHAAVHLVNISNFSPLPLHNYTYALEVYDYDSNQWIQIQSGEEQTDSHGYSVFHTDPIILADDLNYFWSSLRLTIEILDGMFYRSFLYKDWTHYYYTLWGGQQESNYDKYQFVVSSDKTIYSPGETINLRTLVFQYTYLNETRTPYYNQEVDLAIYNPDELAIFWTTLHTNAEGVAVIEFPLDYESETGSYGFEFSIGEITYYHIVRVDFYEKPVFRVSIDTYGKDFFPSYQGIEKLLRKEMFEGFVDVQYYFGQPVVDAEVSLILKDYWGEEVKQIMGKTNALGHFTFSIDLKWLKGIDWSFTVDAIVTDSYGRIAETSKKYTRMEDIIAYGYLTDWAPLPDEPAEYYFNVFQVLSSNDWWGYEFNPLSNVTTDITIYGIEEYPIYITTIRTRSNLDMFTVTTNEFGSGYLEFTLPISEVTAYNLFEIRLEIELEDGRSTEWSTYYRYRKYRLDVQIANPILEPGDTLELTATYEDVLAQEKTEGEGRIYIYDSEYRLLGRSNFEIDGFRTFDIQIPHLAPEGTYYLYSYVYSRSNDFYGGFLYHSVYKQFSVGSLNEIVFATNFTEAEDNSVTVNIGDTINIEGTTNVSSNQPYYLEIYKRGLLYSEELNIIDGEFTRELTITSEMAPDFCIMIYTISDTGKLVEKYLVVHVNYEKGFKILTDKDIYRPGDLITLTVIPNDENPMLLSTTFIDSSVLAIEPEDDSELAFFERSSYHAYIGSGSSWGTGVNWENYAWINYEVPSGGMHIPFFYYPGGFPREGWDLVAFDNEMEVGIDIENIINAYDINIRDNISESANWVPSRVITGPTNFTFQLPDNIGEWTIRIVGNAIKEENILWGDVETIEIKAYLPFFVEFDPPNHISQDEIITLKAYVFNYVGQDLVTDVVIDAPGFDILNNPVQIVQVPNNFVSEIEFSLHARNAFAQNITVVAVGENGDIVHTDAKQMKTYVYPNGFEITENWAEFINESMGSFLFNYTLEEESISHMEELAFFDDILDISIEGWESLVGYPYGCLEQTTSKLLSTALIYHYLNQTGQLTQNIISELTPMIMHGLSRLYDMQNVDGGWGWWSDDESNIQMTTLAVNTLQYVDLAGFDVNSYRLHVAYSFIIDAQGIDGSWIYPYYTANPFEATAYTLKILISSTNKTASIESAIQSALNFLTIEWNDITHRSSYGAALFLISTLDTAYENSTFSSIMLDYLAMNRKTQGDIVFWENDAAYYWSNLGNRVEITAYATLALAKHDLLGNYGIIQKSVKFLLDSKSQWGWWSTADSSAAIYTLTEIHQLSGGSPLLNFNGIVKIQINSPSTPQILLNLTDSSNIPSSILTEISEFLVIGDNLINITVLGTGQLAFIFQGSQLVRFTPEISIPSVIDVNNDHIFNITVGFDVQPSNLEIHDSILSLSHLPEQFHGSDTLYIPLISGYSEFNFTLQAPYEEGEYDFGNILISAELVLENDSHNSIAFYKTMGPVLVRVHEEEIPVSNSLNPFNFYEEIPTATEDTELSLQKKFSKTENLIPGEMVTVTIDIHNPELNLQYYALDDFIPTGMILSPESIRINNLTLDDTPFDITVENSITEIHFFLPRVPDGITSLKYSLLVDTIKNSLVKPAVLWGMYENITVSSKFITLENIPLQYNIDSSIYQDLIYPSITSYSLEQIEKVEEVILSLDMEIFDNNAIQKLRFIYRQGSAWRSQSLYFTNEYLDIQVEIEGLDNIDSKVDYFMEVQDEYGNIVTSSIQQIIVHSTIIPYLSIGIGIVLSLGVASLIAIFYSKKFQKRLYFSGVSFSGDSDETRLD